VITTCSTAPTSPASRRRLSAAKLGSKRRLKPKKAGVPMFVGFLQAQVDRLFAEDRLAGARRRDREPRVRIGGGGDEHRADLAIGEGFGFARHIRPVARGELLRRVGVDIDDVAQPNVLRSGDIGGVDLADAAGAELGDFQHCLSSMINRGGGQLWPWFA
jgi:hypothetical protein